jgi:hypothetical protein
MRKDYTVGLNLTGNTLDDPDQNFYENYACGAVGNYNGYCDPEVDKLIDRQSTEPDQEKRKQLVGNREKVGGGRRSADHLLRSARDLLAALRERVDDHGQQRLQRCAHGRRLAG